MRRRLIVVALLVVALLRGAALALLWTGSSSSPQASRSPSTMALGAERPLAPGASVPRAPREEGETAPEQAPGPSEAQGVLALEVRAHERPLSGAGVRLYARGMRDPNLGETVWRLAGTGLTDAQGQARLAAPPGSYLVVVRASGLAPRMLGVVRPHGEARTSLRLVLEPGHSLEGLTVEKRSREPLPLVQLAFTGARDARTPGAPPIELPPDERVYATSDERGRFRVDGLAADAYRLEAQAPGHARERLDAVVLPAARPLEVALRAAGVIEGFVVDSHGAPAEGAEVQVSGFTPQSAVTGPGGGFSIEVEAGTYGVSARHGQEAGALEQSLTLGEGRTVRGLRLQLGPGSVLEGRVRAQASAGTASEPVAGARVEVSPHAENGDTGREVTDEAGHFRVSPLAPGSYDVVVSAPGFTPTLRRALTVTPREVFSVDIELTRMGAVEGWVRDAAGQPVAHARVLAPNLGPEELESSPLESRTDAGGHYRLEGIHVGGQPLSARRDEATQGVSRWVEVEATGTASLDFTLEATGRVEGVVRAAPGARLPSSLRVFALRGEENPQGTSEHEQAPVDEQGHFQMVLPVGPYEFLLAAADHSSAAPRTGTRVEEGRTAQVELSWEEPAARTALEGTVLEPDGAPSLGATVLLLDESSGDLLRIRHTDDQGHFSLGLEAGEVGRPRGPLTVRALQGGRGGQVTGVRPGERALVISLKPPASLRGRVTRGGQPVHGFTLAFKSVDSPWVLSDKGPWEFPGDHFDLHDVPAQPLRVTVSTAEGARGETWVKPHPGETTQVDIPLTTGEAPAPSGPGDPPPEEATPPAP